jgi:hypothetical protein
MRFGCVGGRSPEIEPSAGDHASVGTSSIPGATAADAPTPATEPSGAALPAEARPAVGVG